MKRQLELEIERLRDRIELRLKRLFPYDMVTPVVKVKLSNLRGGVRLFMRAWQRYLHTYLYAAFSGFEAVKRVVARSLYRQRGRFARPFIHTAMGGIVALAVTLAPVVANSFPGVDPQEVTPESAPQELMKTVEPIIATQISDKVRDKVQEYVVQNGDTLSGIADKFGVSTDTVRWENNLASVNSIKPGQKLRILPVTGVRHKVERGETIYTIAKKYQANAQAIVDFPFNTFSDNENFSLAVGQDLIVPEGEKPNESPWSPQPRQYLAQQRTPNAGSVSATGQFAWPMQGVITQGFYWYHRGLDIATTFGTPIVAADSGKVTVSGWPDNGGYGLRVVIDHGNGFQTWYAHLSRTAVVAGQTVKRGDVIGYEGSTGRSTGPHLHFEIRLNGANQNPLKYLK